MPSDNRDIQIRKTVESMCLTWRHDYGLNKTTSCSLSSGMTEQEREILRGRMAQLHAHHIAPLEQEILRLRNQMACLQVSQERIEKAANEMGRDRDSAESPIEYVLSRAQSDLPCSLAAMKVAGWADTKYLDQMTVGDCDGLTLYKVRERKNQEPLYRKVEATRTASAPDIEHEA